VLGNALLQRDTNVQQFPISHGMSPNGTPLLA
jgi:hypothetical protein